MHGRRCHFDNVAGYIAIGAQVIGVASVAKTNKR